MIKKEGKGKKEKMVMGKEGLSPQGKLGYSGQGEKRISDMERLANKEKKIKSIGLGI